MGYYTYHSLTVLKTEETEALAIIADLRETCEEAKYALDENGSSNESTKWYEHEEHMISFSKKYPNHTFELSGEGEESGDLWKQYYKNGKMQNCNAEITYPKFDETKLK